MKKKKLQTGGSIEKLKTIKKPVDVVKDAKGNYWIKGTEPKSIKKQLGGIVEEIKERIEGKKMKKQLRKMHKEQRKEMRQGQKEARKEQRGQNRISRKETRAERKRGGGMKKMYQEGGFLEPPSSVDIDNI